MADYLVLEEDGTSHLELEGSTDDLLLEESGAAAASVNRLSQLPAEVVVRPNPSARTSQAPIEVVLRPNPAARLSQDAVEVLLLPVNAARESQYAVETVILTGGGGDRITQLVAEIVVTHVTIPGPRPARARWKGGDFL